MVSTRARQPCEIAIRTATSFWTEAVSVFALRATISTTTEGQTSMQIYYLEIVTPQVDQVCAAYAAANDVQFGAPDAGLGNARTAPMPGGGLVGVRAPLRESEAPIVRPYWLVKDIKAAVAAVEAAGGEIAVPPTEIPGHGRFAIYLQGGVDHGLWQR
jgi:predicted enzyme related to lactoylglutathione lyase